MTYKEIMTKLKSGEALTAEEYADLEKESRPAARFNEVSEDKRKAEASLQEANDKIKQLEADALEAQQKVDDQVQAQLRELSGKLETLTAENGELKSAKAQADTLLTVNTLARKNDLGVVIKNPDYLAFCMQRDKVDLNDAEAVKTFLTKFKEESPELCNVEVKSGSGAGGNEPKSTGSGKPVKDWTPAERVAFIKENGEQAYLEQVKNSN